jgi:hypothetical protein
LTNQSRRDTLLYKENRMKQRNYKRVECEDGFSISIQAGDGKYCQPRADDAFYLEVELGYPSQPDYLIHSFADDKDDPTGTVYGYVPVDTVYLLLTKHGGVIGGEVPRGVPVYGEGMGGNP